MNLWKERRTKLVLGVAQGLEVVKAKGLSLEFVNYFYKNMKKYYVEFLL